MVRQFLQRRHATLVALDRDHALCAEREERARQPARPRTHFDDGHALEWAGCSRDARCEVEVEEKILPERSAGGQAVAADHLAQRRQVVATAHAAVERRAARSRGATKLDGWVVALLLLL